LKTEVRTGRMLNTRVNKFKVSCQKQWIKKDTPTPEGRWHHNTLPLLKTHILYISELIHTQHICNIWLSSFAFPNPPSIWENNCRTIYLNEHYIFYPTFLQRLTNKWFPWRTACSFTQPIIINIKTDSCVMLYYICSPYLSVNTFCLNYKSFLCQKHIQHRENTTQEQWLPRKLGLTHSITHARVLYKVYYCYFVEFVT